jgi:hypothetical protein
LLENQAQADALRTLKHLVRENLFKSVFTLVKRHVVEHNVQANCILPERLNDIPDHLAT